MADLLRMGEGGDWKEEKDGIRGEEEREGGRSSRLNKSAMKTHYLTCDEVGEEEEDN